MKTFYTRTLIWLSVFAFATAHAFSAAVVISTRVTGQTASGNSSSPIFSKDGRHIAFLSDAKDLATNRSTSPSANIFLRDLDANTTLLVSAGGGGTATGNGNSGFPSLSSNAQVIAFESLASNLVPWDTNDCSDVFVRNLQTQTTMLVSRAPAENANGPSFAPLLSLDARRVVFESMASNLVSADVNANADIFFGDLDATNVSLVSLASDGIHSANGKSFDATIDAAARRILFVSTATNIVDGVTNSAGEIYERDLTAGQTYWISRDVATFLPGLNGAFRCMHPAISLDGSVALFEVTTNSSNPASSRAALFRYDLQTHATTLISTNSNGLWPAPISADGRFILYEEGTNIFRWDSQLGSNQLVNVSSNGLTPLNGVSQTPVMTDDGRQILFLSNTGDLASNPAGVFQLYLRDMVSEVTSLISINTNQGAIRASDLEAILPAISVDGRVVAFETADAAIVPFDFNHAADVFVRDVLNQSSSSISLRATELPGSNITPGVALTSLGSASISSNGQLVAFTSLDGNAPADTNGYRDIFVRDFSTGATISVSGLPLAGVAHNAVMSADGRSVAFLSNSNSIYLIRMGDTGAPRYVGDLYPGQAVAIENSRGLSLSSSGNFLAFQGSPSVPNGFSAVLLWRTNNNVDLISANYQHTGNGNGNSINPALSRDERYLLFLSGATDLTSASLFSGDVRLFARDLVSGTTRLVSAFSTNNPIPDSVTNFSISSDSRLVAFETRNSHSIYVSDLSSPTGGVTLVCTDCATPSIGHCVVAFTAGTNIYTKNLSSGLQSLISVNTNFTPVRTGASTSPVISPDDRFVVFTSKAADLVDADTNGFSDVFVRDRLLGMTVLVSRSIHGASGNGPSARPALSPDGRTIAFETFAHDLVTNDFSFTRNIFISRIEATDSDQDGMDDEWELAFFNTLSRNGTGDFDGDGLSDHDEFIAGTDPTNAGSVLRVVVLQSLNTGMVSLAFASVPGRTYSIQYKDSVTAPSWSTVADRITAISTTTIFQDFTVLSHTQRFYRVLQKP